MKTKTLKKYGYLEFEITSPGYGDMQDRVTKKAIYLKIGPNIEISRPEFLESRIKKVLDGTVAEVTYFRVVLLAAIHEFRFDLDLRASSYVSVRDESHLLVYNLEGKVYVVTAEEAILRVLNYKFYKSYKALEDIKDPDPVRAEVKREIRNLDLDCSVLNDTVKRFETATKKRLADLESKVSDILIQHAKEAAASASQNIGRIISQMDPKVIPGGFCTPFYVAPDVVADSLRIENKSWIEEVNRQKAIADSAREHVRTLKAEIKKLKENMVVIKYPDGSTDGKNFDWNRGYNCAIDAVKRLNNKREPYGRQ